MTCAGLPLAVRKLFSCTPTRCRRSAILCAIVRIERGGLESPHGDRLPARRERLIARGGGMREEMYIPGQDDFPNWDEFYSWRAPQHSRMRYSFKTLLLLPLLVAFVCFMYLLGYEKGTWDQERLTADLAAERRTRELAERSALNDAAL